MQTSLKSVYEQLETLAGTSSTLQKETLLKEYLKDPLFLKVIQYTLDTSKTFNVKKFPEYKPLRGTFGPTDIIFEYLDKLNSQEGASKYEKQTLYNLCSVDPETYEVVRRICIADLRCGVSRKLVNSARPDTIFFVPYQRCSTAEKSGNIDFSNGAHIQEKADGMFSTMDVSHGSVTFYTRDGKQVQQLEPLKRIITDYVSKYPEWDNMAWTGEFRVMNPGGSLMPRKQGNGILNKLIHGTAPQHEANKAVFSMWDGMPREDFWGGYCATPYDNRLADVQDFVADLGNDRFDVIESSLVYSLEEAQGYYARMRREGKEGAIIKNRKAPWKDGTSPDQIKMKNVSDAELRIVGWNEGNGKYTGLLGSLKCATECGLCEVNVSGMSDEQRAWNMDEMLGKIVTVEYESVIKSKTDKVHSLYLPRFVEVRHDRSEADTLQDLLTR